MAVRCDGSYSCNDIEGYILAENGGDIFASGYRSIFGSSSDELTIISTTKQYNIYCSGESSCESKQIENADNLYCLGVSSCSSAYLIRNINNVWMYGSDSGSSAKIEDISNTVYCGARDSCSEAIINNVKNDVFGFGMSALENANITNVSNLLAFGLFSLYQASINNVSNVYCDGVQSCQGANMTGIKTLTSVGRAALGYSTIISNLNNHYGEYEFNAIINGSNYNEYAIYCSEGDRCTIECQTEEACTDLCLYCYGTCFVYCGNGIDCPSCGNDNYTTVTNTVTPMTSIIAIATTQAETSSTDSSTSDTDTDSCTKCQLNAMFVWIVSVLALVTLFQV